MLSCLRTGAARQGDDPAQPLHVYAAGVPKNMQQGLQRLSPIDHSAILTCINPKAFWFPAPGLSASTLRLALARTLADFPLLAGRLTSESGSASLASLRKRLDCCISVCNAGVEFVEVNDAAGRRMSNFPLGAMARSGFTHMSANPVLPDFFTPVNIDKLLSGSEPLLKVRLTQLACGGSILALTLAHAVLDGHSAAMFINHLARNYRSAIASTGSAPEDAAAQQATLAPLQTKPVMECSALLLGAPLKPGKGTGADFPVELTAAAHASSTAPHRLACLALQQVPAPGWGSALVQIKKLISMVQVQEKAWPGLRDNLCSLVLHVPVAQVADLKALARSAGENISTNDAVAGLVWTLMCHLRERPLPGQAPPGSNQCLGLAVDLRKNGFQGEVPTTLFANATWCLHIPSAPSANPDPPASSPPTAASAAGGALVGLPDGHHATQLVAALRQGSLKVRQCLTEFRASNSVGGKQVLELAAAQCQAPLSSQLKLACNVMMGQDTMMSSWQFPYWEADFGAGGPLRYMGVLHPTPPWSAAVMAAHPSHGGLYLFLVVPSSAQAALRNSPVLSTLVPAARFA